MYNLKFEIAPEIEADGDILPGVTCLFGAAALPVVGRLGVRWWKRGTERQWGAMLALLLVASAVPRDIRTFHAERAGHRQAGQWLAEHADQSSPVVDPFGWAEFYSGRTVRGWTTANPYRGPTVYAVVEPNAKSHHSRLPWLEPATRLMAQGELVFQYPAGVPADQIHVAVYKSPPLKP